MTTAKCELCGQPLPLGEEMFKFHGYSGPCPVAPAEPPENSPNFADAAEMLWTVVANVSGGDWSKQTPEWQAAAARWRDYYLQCIQPQSAPAEPQTPEPETATLLEAVVQGASLASTCGCCYLVPRSVVDAAAASLSTDIPEEEGDRA